MQTTPTMPTKHNWKPILGKIETTGGDLIFKGEIRKYPGQEGGETTGPAIGNIISNEYFSEGTISADVEFTNVEDASSCEIIFYYDSTTQDFITAGFSRSPSLYTIRGFFGRQWTYYTSAGEHENLKAKTKYNLKIILKGSKVVLVVDGVEILSTVLPFTLRQSQVGIWCMNSTDIKIANYKVDGKNPKAFAVMQFTSPYNELYKNVIKKICEKEFKLEVIRSDEAYGPGIIVADIARQINESKIIIAEITPSNANVFYEVGYAHALGKPVILVAQVDTELPFDISAFRTLFYENTIAGKEKIEEGLRNHLKAILIQ